MLKEKIVEVAKTYLGTPYSKLDCSAFVRAVFRNFGIELPRVSAEQGRYLYNKGLTIDVPAEATTAQIISKLQVGDVLCWKNPKYVTRWKKIHHIAIYIGGGKIIESTGDPGVHIGSLWESSKWQVILLGHPIQLIKGYESEDTDVLKKGDKNSLVKKWQENLLKAGYELPKYGADGN
jgi:cell wall-associated NlpC family hydrolase